MPPTASCSRFLFVVEERFCGDAVVVQFHAEIEGRAAGVRTLAGALKNYLTKIQPALLPFAVAPDHW